MMMKNVLFLCGIYPQPYKDDILKNSKKGYQFAAQNLQEALVEGFIQNKVNISIVSVPFLSTYPLGYRKPIVKYDFSKFNGIVSTKCASFVNIPFLQHFLSTAEKDVFEWCRSHNGVKHIVVYSLSLNLMKIAIKAKRKFDNVRLTIIVPDLPEFFGSHIFYSTFGLDRRRTLKIYEKIHFFDNFILLSEAMASKLKIDKKKFTIVEGIFNTNSSISKDFEFEEDTINILYTGALNQKYGIDSLLKAFTLIPNSEYRLIICGDGEARRVVEEFTNLDNRIIYMGKVSYDLILRLQQLASLLINPRTPEGEYTKFSFPSKTMEYFASGTPVLMYRLPGVPHEYFNYCYIQEQLSHEGLAMRIIEILGLPLEDRIQMGEKAKNFILEQKNAENQVRKIIDLMNEF